VEKWTQSMRNARSGQNNPHWKGGKFKRKSDGYISILKPDHHFASAAKRVMQHRLVWEQHNNAVLLSWSHVHHINGKRDDNRIENLQAMMKHDHWSITKKKIDKKYRMTLLTVQEYQLIINNRSSSPKRK